MIYESLTNLIPQIADDTYGEWFVDKENDGSPEHPIQMPYVMYSGIVHELMEAIYNFVDTHTEMELNHYYDILEKNGLFWDANSMANADFTHLDGQCIMAILVGAVRAERFCDGALLGFLKDGTVSKCLKRLKSIDEEK